jgi:pathogenesis-related protein 1
MIRALVVALAFATACSTTAPESAAASLAASPMAKKKPTVKLPPITTTPSLKPKPAAPSGEETGKLEGMTAAHNEVRAAVGVGPLTWSNELGAYAQQWADQLAANGCQLAHRSGDSYGENLFWKMSPSGATASQVVAWWAEEKVHYDHATNTCAAGSTCGHYTQVVWAATTKLGCGQKSCGDQKEVWVCNYDPQGNYAGQAPY